jgi:glutamine synthetase
MLEPRQVKTIADAKAIVEQRNLSHVKVGVFDIDGIMRGKYMSRSKFVSALENGYGFCDVVLGWDCQDQLYDNVKFTGWHTGYPDAPVRILPDSCRALPFEAGGAPLAGRGSVPVLVHCDSAGSLSGVGRRAHSGG